MESINHLGACIKAIAASSGKKLTQDVNSTSFKIISFRGLPAVTMVIIDQK